MEELAEALFVACAVVVAEKRLPAEREAREQEQDNHADLERDAHGGDLLVAVGQKKLVDEYGADAGHDVDDRGRDADCENILDMVGGDSGFLDVER